MSIAILLTLVVLFMAIYTVVLMSKRMAWMLLSVYGFTLLLVWQPHVSTFIAHHLGVGRGLDLFLMLATIILLNAMIIMARHINQLHQRQTCLARNIALYRAHAEQPGGIPRQTTDSQA